MYNAYAKVWIFQLYHFLHNINSLWVALGVKLEYGPNRESNNTLITSNSTQNDEEVLYCSTDRDNDEFNIPGSWFLPNGSKITSSTVINTRLLHIAFRNQTVGLNIIPDLPSGIYHCEMMDRDNITHHLYAGIYSEDEGIMLIAIIAIIAKQYHAAVTYNSL